MKKMLHMLTVLLVAAFVLLPVLACADTSEDIRVIEDTVKGDNPSCPMLGSLYVAKTFKDVSIGPVKGNWRVELSYMSNINEIHNNNAVTLRTGLEF